MHNTSAPMIVLGLLGAALLALGLARDVWWTIAGGMSALAACAWLFTEPHDPT